MYWRDWQQKRQNPDLKRLRLRNVIVSPILLLKIQNFVKPYNKICALVTLDIFAENIEINKIWTTGQSIGQGKL